MNLPVQPESDTFAVFTEAVCPPQADADPYFSVASHIQAGPIESSHAEALSQIISERRPTENSETEPINLIDEIDRRVLQLEDPQPAKVSEGPMPIRGGLRVEGIETESEAESLADNTSSTSSAQSSIVYDQDANGHFIARDRSIVEIDGNDGYDFIDLSDREITHVTFKDSSIVVFDSTANQLFTIRYRNINRAMFSHGHMIELP